MTTTPRFTPGDTVDVAYIEDGRRIYYRAQVVEDRGDDYVIDVTYAGPGSTVQVGARLAPILTSGDVTMTKVQGVGPGIRRSDIVEPW